MSVFANLETFQSLSLQTFILKTCQRYNKKKSWKFYDLLAVCPWGIQVAPSRCISSASSTLSCPNCLLFADPYPSKASLPLFNYISVLSCESLFCLIHIFPNSESHLYLSCPCGPFLYLSTFPVSTVSILPLWVILLSDQKLSKLFFFYSSLNYICLAPVGRSFV